MHFIIISVLILGFLFGPQLWAQYVFRRHSEERADIPVTGSQFARRLIERFKLDGVGVEETDRGDHYDPEARTVRLSPANYRGRSLTAMAVAAHEVGHALQHHRGETMLSLRTHLVRMAFWAERGAAGVMLALPLVAAVTRAPALGAGMFIVALLSMSTAALAHLVTLPVEWDASFGKAMPVLEAEYIRGEDRDAVRSVLRAAALTYVAASLASLLNVWRWLRLLRRN